MKRWIAFVVSLFVLAPASALALKNPAAVYCTAMGYEYRVEHTANGDVGYCILPGAEIVDAWKFLLGEIAQDKSYCASKGYGHKIVKNPKTCQRFLTDTCMVCILGDGREVEVTELMKLILEETVCGDGVCGIPENYKSCTQDCPSGSRDGYCDRVKDGRCDPDCSVKEDPDCSEKEVKAR